MPLSVRHRFRAVAARFAVFLATIPPLPLWATAQERVITGTVVAEGSLVPIQGAKVTLVGTTQTVFSDAAGRFSLRVANGTNPAVAVMRIGYRALTTAPVQGNGHLTVALTESAQLLDAIVVTGTAGVTENRAVGNAVDRAAVPDALKAAPAADIQQVIAARAPGVMITPTQGLAAGGAVTRIRGVSSMFLPNEPLLYVDGIRVDNNTRAGPYIRGGPQISRIGDLDPEDIESFEVIKGPAAGTLYGTEASRGVIQIFTRRGVEGPPRFSLTVRQGANWFRNPEGRLNWAYAFNSTGTLDSLHLYQREAAAGNHIFSTGRPQAYNLNVSGGTPVVRYYASAGFDRNEGVVTYDWRNRFSGRANLSVIPSAQLSIETSVGFVRNNMRLGQPTSVGAEIGWDPMTILNWGGPRYLNGSNRGFFRATPEAIQAVESRSANDRVIGSVQIRHRPWSWFSQNLTLGSDVGDETSSVFFPKLADTTFGAYLSEGDKTLDRRHVSMASLDYAATASGVFGEVKSSTSAGMQYYARRSESVRANGHGFPSGVVVIGGAAVTSSFEDVIENKGAGVFVQQQLGWKNRRFLTGALRVDDNSAFGANFNMVVYPKVSVSWVLNEEAFWPFGFINALKLRGAWGQAGRQPDAFAAERTYLPVAGPGGASILTPQNVGNPDLKPERGAELEVGFDAGLWRDRVGASFTYYRQVLRDAIVPEPLAPSNGFPGTRLANIGEVLNDGLEASLDLRLVQSRSIGWDLGAGFSTNDNRIVTLGGLEQISLALPGLALQNGQFHVEGYPVGSYFLPLVVSAGVGADGKAINIQCASGPEPFSPPARCDGSARQRIYAGRTTPSWEGNVRTSVTLWRNLRLHAMVDFRGGHVLWSQTATVAHLTENNTRAWNEADVLLRAYDSLNSQGVAGATFPTGIMKGDFAKLREVSVTYTLPPSWISRLGVSSASLTVAARNLVTLWVAQRDISGFKVLDPETHNSHDLSGNSNNLMPPFTQVTTALRVTF